MIYVVQEAIWICQLLEDLGYKQTSPTTLFGDNQGTVALVENLNDYLWTKHIALHQHFICFAVSNNIALDQSITVLQKC